MPIPEALDLSAGPLHLRLDPAHGGTIRSLVAIARGRPEPLLRLDAGAGTSVFDAACFPIVPFCNRLSHAQLGGDDHAAPVPGVPAPWTPDSTNGLGWSSEWRVRTFDASHAVLQHTHDGSVWPWAYEAEQAFSLTPDALRIVLTLRSRAATAMPCGLALHPFFPKPAHTRLTTVLDGCRATSNAEGHAVWQRLEAADRFDAGRLLDDLTLDQCFTDWNGEALISWPARAFAVSASSSARCLRLQTRPDQPFFCLEPMTHLPDTLDAQRLEPGEERAVTLRIALTPGLVG